MLAMVSMAVGLPSGAVDRLDDCPLRSPPDLFAEEEAEDMFQMSRGRDVE